MEDKMQQPKSLYEKGLECIEDHLWNVDYPTEKEAVSAVAKAIEQLLIEEVGKAFSAGYDYGFWSAHELSIQEERPMDSEEYINQLNELK